MKATIYVLLDENSLPRYVGKTAGTLHARLRGHLMDAKHLRPPCHRTYWIRSMLKKNIKPTIEVLEVCGDNWAEREKYWIAKGKKDGWRLTNGTEGGEGAGVPTPETRAKMSASLKGIVKTPEWRAKLSASKSGVKLTEEHRAAIRKSCSKGFNHTPEACEKIRRAKIGNKHWKGKSHSEETKAKIRRAGLERLAAVPESVKSERARKAYETRRARMAEYWPATLPETWLMEPNISV